MNSLNEQYRQVSSHLDAIVDHIARNEERIKEIGSSASQGIQERIENLEATIKKADEYLLKIRAIQEQAKKHLSSENVPTIETYPGYRVNLDRLRNWLLMVDPESKDDPYAQRAYCVAKCDEQFLELKKREFAEKIRTLRNDSSVGLTREIARLEAENESLRNEISRYLDTQEMLTFYESVKAANDAYTFHTAPQAYANNGSVPPSIAFGTYEAPLHVPPKMPELIAKLKAFMGEYYNDAAGRVRIPFVIDTDREFILSVDCVSNKRGSLDKAVRNLLLQLIDRYPAGTQKVYFIDAVRLNSAGLAGLRLLENSFALSQIPKSPEQVTSLLQELVSQMADLEEELQDYDSLQEYLKAHRDDAKSLTRSTIVLFGWNGSYSSEDRELINKLLRNYERYGFSFVLINYGVPQKDSEKRNIPEYAYDNSIRVTISQNSSIVSTSGNADQRFLPYMLESEISASYINSVLQNETVKTLIGSVYTDRYDLTQPPAYHRGNKTISVPYGVDAKDQPHELSFTNENFAMYLMGASGSGKSTLLHTIITGILCNYHPDDVELWLADFKMGEFSQYIDPMPPHVKYILLDESRELAYDLIDRLTSIMMERQKYFMIHRDKKKVEEVSSAEKYMPIIFVVLDEFSVMSQAISLSEPYRLKLQNLLAKGRALGIKFIFSSQTFVKGIVGLTSTAKEQIQMRVAMKNSPQEIEETLELASFEKTDQVKSWISALPPHYTLVKYRDGDRNRIERHNVMYFNGSDSQNGGTYAAQRSYVELINQAYKPVDRYEPDRADVFMRKNPVVVDGNKYTSYYDSLEAIPKKAGERAVSFGAPRLLVAHRFVPVTDETRENILLLARLNETPFICSIMATTIKHWLYQRGNVEIWAYERNPIFSQHRSVFENLNVKIIKGIDDVCDAIRETKADIEAGKKSNKMIVLIGMDRICGDFSFFNDTVRQSSSVMKTREAIAQKASPKDEWEQAETTIKQAYLTKMRYAKDEAEKKAILESTRKELKEARARIESKGSAIPNNDSSNADKSTASGAYDAGADFSFIIKQGSRFGIHFFLHLSDLSEVKEVGLNINLFRHRLAFQMSADASRDFYNSKVASLLPEHICQYSNLVDSFSFRPYLHEGIEWDGWTLDENKEVVNPMVLED